jgi:hypothetical protein
VLRFFSFLFKDCESLDVVLLTILVVFVLMLFNDEEDNGNEKLLAFGFSKSGEDICKLWEPGLGELAAPINTLLFVVAELFDPEFNSQSFILDACAPSNIY